MKKTNDPIAICCGALLLISTLGLWACKTPASDPTPESEEVIQLSLQLDNRQQTIHNFGASDAWSCQFVGANWPLAKREAIADLLFSQSLKSDGSPAGIALSSWRFNFGAGSARQGENGDIKDEWRRADCFLQADGSMDNNAQAGQRWFLRAARERGVNTFTGFVNSPPVTLTRNGKAYSSGGNSSNLAPNQYEAYATFLADAITAIAENDGILLDYISPVNEPQWDWEQPNQEGSPWKNSEITTLVKLLDQQLRDRKLTTQIEIPETAQIDYLYRMHNRPERGDQIEAFFNPASDTYLGDQDQLAHKVAGHSYFSTWDLDNFIRKRRALAEKLAAFPKLEYWMSEYTLLENNPEVKGNGRDLGIDPALYLARVIHADLTVAGANAWQWWLAVSPYDYKDGLVYIDQNKQDGAIYPSKMLWALGNYSRFIRPGMLRIALDRSDNLPVEATLDGLMASAFMDPESKKMVIVVINYGQDTRAIKVKPAKTSSLFTCYRTSVTEDLQLIGTVGTEQTQQIPARSITTFVEE